MNTISSPQSTPVENYHESQIHWCKKCSPEGNFVTSDYTNFTDLCNVHWNIVKDNMIELYNTYPENSVDWKEISQKIHERTQLVFKPSTLRQRFFSKLNQKLDSSKITPQEGVIINNLARNGLNRWKQIASELQEQTKSPFLRSTSKIRYWYITHGEGASLQQKSTTTKRIPVNKNAEQSESNEISDFPPESEKYDASQIPIPCTPLTLNTSTTILQVSSDSVTDNTVSQIAQICKTNTQQVTSTNSENTRNKTIYTQLRSIPKDEKAQLDTLILTQYKMYNPNKVSWNDIATNIAKISPFNIPAIRLKDRFFHYIDPNLDKSPIEEPEASRICELALQHQKEWAIIAKILYEEKKLQYELFQNQSQCPPKKRSAELLRHWYRNVGEQAFKYSKLQANSTTKTTISQMHCTIDPSISAERNLFENINSDSFEEF